MGRGGNQIICFTKEFGRYWGRRRCSCLAHKNIPKLFLELWKQRIAVWHDTGISRLQEQRRLSPGELAKAEGPIWAGGTCSLLRHSNRPTFGVAQMCSLAEVGKPSLAASLPSFLARGRVSLVSSAHTPFSPERIPAGSAPGVSLQRCAQALQASDR